MLRKCDGHDYSISVNDKKYIFMHMGHGFPQQLPVLENSILHLM